MLSSGETARETKLLLALKELKNGKLPVRRKWFICYLSLDVKTISMHSLISFGGGRQRVSLNFLY